MQAFGPCGKFTATTSPELQADLTQNRPVRHSWLAGFLLDHDSNSRDDIYEGTERILPGEFICICRNGFDAFVSNLSNPQTSTNPLRSEKDCIWLHKKYKAFTDSREALAAELRKTIGLAVQRIPCENPVFTLSGGLDSTAILSSWCKFHPGQFDALSLISKKHADCDESHELDILEKAFPIHLTRNCMDDAWPLSRPELYHQYLAYGPWH